jgi:hypothetical protein
MTTGLHHCDRLNKSLKKNLTAALILTSFNIRSNYVNMLKENVFLGRSAGSSVTTLPLYISGSYRAFCWLFFFFLAQTMTIWLMT